MEGLQNLCPLPVRGQRQVTGSLLSLRPLLFPPTGQKWSSWRFFCLPNHAFDMRPPAHVLRQTPSRSIINHVLYSAGLLRREKVVHVVHCTFDVRAVEYPVVYSVRTLTENSPSLLYLLRMCMCSVKRRIRNVQIICLINIHHKNLL